ncbi:MAG: FkbM family methyltransferase [Gemmatimonadaceae bacterium]
MSLVDLVAVVTRQFPSVKGAGFVANSLRELSTSVDRPTSTRTIDWQNTIWELDLREVTEAAVFFFPQLYNRRELDFLRSVTPVGGAFLDVGSNIGFYSVSMARHVGPTGKCLAIEADPETAAKVRATLKRNALHWISVSENAVSDAVGVARFEIRVDGNRGGSGLVDSGGRAASAASRVVEVPTQPLLTLMQDNGVTAVDSMKVDLEGHEERVFETFFSTAPRSLWPRHLVVEFLAEAGAKRPLHVMLEKAGYVERGRTAENLMLSLGGA